MIPPVARWGGGPIFFTYEPFPDLSAYAWQIWSQSDGHVEKKVGYRHTYTHMKGHCSFIIVDR